MLITVHIRHNVVATRPQENENNSTLWLDYTFMLVNNKLLGAVLAILNRPGVQNRGCLLCIVCSYVDFDCNYVIASFHTPFFFSLFVQNPR